jgi:response regulator of citrate/malate metabolism
MRKDPLEIISAMFDMLEKEEAVSINSMAKKTGIHNITIKRYIEIIRVIRNEPEIEIINTGHSIIMRVKRRM